MVSAFDQAFTDAHLGRTVDRQRSYDDVIEAEESGEGVAFDLTSHGYFRIDRNVTAKLDVEIELIAPVPNRLAVIDVLPEHRERCGLGLVGSVLVGFLADMTAEEAVLFGDVAGGKDILIAGAALPIDDNAVIGDDACVLGKASFRHDADPDHNGIAIHQRPVIEFDLSHPTI